MNSCIIFSGYVTVGDGKECSKLLILCYTVYLGYMTSSVSDKTKYLGLQINHDPWINKIKTHHRPYNS